MLELKHTILSSSKLTLATPNRTMLELKHDRGHTSIEAKNSQSHHAGIETCICLNYIIFNRFSQSHHAGIETSNVPD